MTSSSSSGSPALFALTIAPQARKGRAASGLSRRLAKPPPSSISSGPVCSEDDRGQPPDLVGEQIGGSLDRAQAGDRELARVRPGEAGVCVPVAVVAGAHVHVVGGDAEDVGDDLGGDGLVALALRGRSEGDDDLAEDVELDARHLVVARELEIRVQELGLAEVVRPRVERRADADAEQLSPALGVSPLLLERRIADEVEGDVEAARVVAGVVDAAVRRLVGHLLGLDVVALADLDRVELELVGDDVDHALREPEVLHARVAPVRPAGGLVRAHLREVDVNVAPAVHPRRHLRPDDAAERLVAAEGSAVVDRLAR